MIIDNGQYLSDSAYKLPDQFVPTKKKMSDKSWIKQAVDHYATMGMLQYTQNNNLRKNLLLLEGKFDFNDYLGSQDYESMVDALSDEVSLPSHLKHYSIVNAPINTMVGEISKMRDKYRAFAFDDESKNDKIRTKNDMLERFVYNEFSKKIYQNVLSDTVNQLKQKNPNITESEIQKQISKIQGDMQSQVDQQTMALPEIQEYMGKTYEGVAEQYANKRKNYCRSKFGIKQKEEQMFKHYLATGKCFLHAYTSNTPVGFEVEVINPANVFHSKNFKKKFDQESIAHLEYIGFVDYYNISNIIQRWKLDESEIKELKKELGRGFQGYYTPENSFNNKTGYDSIDYTTRDTIRELQQEDIENFWSSGDSNLASNVGTTFSNQILVSHTYFQSKKRIGKLTYYDENGEEISTIVSEDYDFNKKLGDISIEWEWKNEWWTCTKIGKHIYKTSPVDFQTYKPFSYYDYPPIVGIIDQVSFLDMAKPMQVGYNIVVNQIFEMLAKEPGPALLTPLQFLPKLKDWGDEDAVEKFIQSMKEGLVLLDVNKENQHVAGAFNQFQTIDLNYVSRIQSRIQLAQFFKTECWELIGTSQQRLAQMKATETATATTTSMDQSVAQTQGYFNSHDYMMKNVYQLIVDICQYVECYDENTTLSYLANDMESAFLKLSSERQRLTDLAVEMISDANEDEIMNDLKRNAQAMLQTGLSPLAYAEILSSPSVSRIKEIFETNQKKIEEQQKAQQEQEQAQMEQQQKQFEAQAQAAKESEQIRLSEAQKDRDTKILIAEINSLAGNEPDINENKIPDQLEIDKFTFQKEQKLKELSLQEGKNNRDYLLKSNDHLLKDKKLNAEIEKMGNDLKIARENKSK